MTDPKPSRRDVLIGTAAAAAAVTVPGGAQAQAQTAARGAALVTGSSSGFGRLTAVELARAGFTTFASMRETTGRNAEAARTLTAEAEADGLPLEVIDIDVRDTASVEAGVARAAAAGPLDVVVNNAGIIIPGPVELHSEAQMRAQFETNVFGYHRLARAALPAMRAQGQGLLVQISSGLGRVVFPTQGWYVSNKFCLEGMSEALAYELAPFGVEVTIVQPTNYPTRFLANGRRYFEEMLPEAGAERLRAYDDQIAMTRFGIQDEPGEDPQAVALAIREVADLPPGRRPLRRVVSPHPGGQGLDRLNAGLAAAQDAVLADTPFAAWRAAVTD